MRYPRAAWAGALALLLGTGAGLALADEKADALLKEAREATAKLKSLSAELEADLGPQKITGTMTLQRPNLARVELKPPLEMVIVSNGKEVIQYQAQPNQYVKQAAAADGGNVFAPFAADFMRSFFVPESLNRFPPGAEVNYAGRQKLDGKDYEVVEVVMKEPQPQTARYFISPADHLVHRIERNLNAGNRTIKQVVTLKNVRANAPVEQSTFVYNPPATAKLYERPNFEANLIPVGKPAPDFNLKMPKGGQLALSDTVKKNKATLVNFWFYGWGACRAEFPHLQKIYQEYKDKGLEIVAVNANDTEEVINKYVGENNFTFPIVMGGRGPEYTVGKAYGVQAYPTNYLLDSEGKVIWRGVGFNEQAMRDALAKAGFK